MPGRLTILALLLGSEVLIASLAFDGEQLPYGSQGLLWLLKNWGDAGWKDIAVRGFHSQAGWISFNGVAFARCLGARRIAWISAAVVQLDREAATGRISSRTLSDTFPGQLAILPAGTLSGR